MPFDGSCAGGGKPQSLPAPPPAPVKRSATSATSSRSGVATGMFGAPSKIRLLAQMLLCVVGINLCFGWWSVKQERAITKPYFIADSAFAASMVEAGAANNDARRAAAVAAAKSNAPPGKPNPVYLSTVYGISLSQTLAGAIVSAMLLGADSLLRHSMRRRQPTELNQRQGTALSRRDVPEMLAMGFSNILGTSLGHAAMRRLSYPVALTAKMGKMLPVMLVGFAWYRIRYPPKKVASCLLITGGVIGFFLLENRIVGAAKASSPATTGSSSTDSTTKGGASSSSSLLGITLVLLNLLLDGYTNSTQDILVKRYRWSGVSLMLRTNLASVMCALLLLFTLEFGEQPWLWMTSFSHYAVASAARRFPVSSSALGRAPGASTGRPGAGLAASAVPFHDLSHFLAFLVHCPEARHDVLLISLLSALGQLFVFHTITIFGTLTLTAMTLLRKGGSVLLSIVVHGHHVQSGQWISLGAVFSGVLLDGYINIQETSPPRGPAAKKGTGVGGHEQHAQKGAAPHGLQATASSSACSRAAPTSGRPAPEGASAILKNKSEAADAAATALAGVRALRSIAVASTVTASPSPKAKKTQ
ncbi:hypothetical protein JIQ42_05547 [Leishmania sp. Namibia]|uniref:hypothetical protein n=1 Tax=Leishmania sp. Namibia TaxID=2802991 RepID=UPI001B5A02B5|nr:hypothetical protein JIQ42_05547 [Leishmania sp. Namibia]